MSSFLNLGEERRKGEYEKVEGNNHYFQERHHTKDREVLWYSQGILEPLKNLEESLFSLR